VVPGTADPLSDAAEARRIALEIGLPVMLKAAAGGGGKGMRRVDDVDRLDDALASAQSEATKSFGDDAVYVEKYVVNPRHVEIQVLADGHGNCVHLFERDCSIQRRHQKVVEEAPSPVLSEETRAAMGEVAVQAARAVGYVGAGTCEFLYAEDGSFYFLEMNTRLQVEHPITEMITGVDLARMQLRVARGETLPFAQTDLSIRGHAIECRIYAEDPYANFRPAPGPLFGYVEPVGPFVRVDSGAWEGGEVPIHYDPMIAKLIVWGSDRSEALSRLKRALDDYHIVGIDTSIPFFKALLEDEAFIAGQYTTGFLQGTWLESNMVKSEDDAEWAAIAAAIARATDDLELATKVDGGGHTVSPWKQTARWQHTTRGGLR
ncbi:MAG: acetyl-CoA carboxylase biotin carboxylase subunit, partial [Myxococcota bacterium]